MATLCTHVRVDLAAIQYDVIAFADCTNIRPITTRQTEERNFLREQKKKKN